MTKVSNFSFFPTILSNYLYIWLVYRNLTLMTCVWALIKNDFSSGIFLSSVKISDVTRCKSDHISPDQIPITDFVFWRNSHFWIQIKRNTILITSVHIWKSFSQFLPKYRSKHGSTDRTVGSRTKRSGAFLPNQVFFYREPTRQPVKPWVKTGFLSFWDRVQSRSIIQRYVMMYQIKCYKDRLQLKQLTVDLLQ